MRECCEGSAEVSASQRRVLGVVLAINAGMFLVECLAGLLAHSTALLADSVDMLGDAIVYGFSLYVVSRGVIWQARAALLKGLIMAGFGAVVAAEVSVKLARGTVPSAEVMGGIGLLALLANATCLLLLWRRRADDLNMRSAWVCSLNDVVGNAGVLLASAGVMTLQSAWPDIAVGLAIAILFTVSAVGVLGRARRALSPSAR